MRKVQRVVVEASGRDKGKTFVLTEMSAVRAERWAARAYLAMSRAKVEVPEEYVHLGLVGLAIVGLQKLTNVTFEEVEPLLDEMLICVQVAPDKANPDLVRPCTFDGDVEEIATLLFLRQKVFELHAGFTLADARSKLGEASAFLSS